MKPLIKDKPLDHAEWPAGLRLEDRQIPSNLATDEVLVKVLAAGICGTDVGIYHSKKSICGIIGRRLFETWETMRSMLKSGLAQVFMNSGFITAEMPLEKFDDAMALIGRGEAFKVILKP